MTTGTASDFDEGPNGVSFAGSSWLLGSEAVVRVCQPWLTPAAALTSGRSDRYRARRSRAVLVVRSDVCGPVGDLSVWWLQPGQLGTTCVLGGG